MDKEVQELVTELINYDSKEDLSWLQVLKNLLKERNLEYNDEILKKVTKEIPLLTLTSPKILFINSILAATIILKPNKFITSPFIRKKLLFNTLSLFK